MATMAKIRGTEPPYRQDFKCGKKVGVREAFPPLIKFAYVRTLLLTLAERSDLAEQIDVTETRPARL